GRGRAPGTAERAHRLHRGPSRRSRSIDRPAALPPRAGHPPPAAGRAGLRSRRATSARVAGEGAMSAWTDFVRRHRLALVALGALAILAVVFRGPLIGWFSGGGSDRSAEKPDHSRHGAPGTAPGA